MEGAALARLADGRLVVAGTTSLVARGPVAIALGRFTPSGAVDDGFGTAGSIVTTAAEGVVSSLALTADEGMVVGGSLTATSPQRALVAHYDRDGNLDPAFGTDGLVTTPPGAIGAIAVQGDGKIVAGLLPASSAGFYVAARYLGPPALGICGDTQVDAVEACDLGSINGSSASCCTTSCTFQPSNFPCDTGKCTGSGDGCLAPAYVAIGDSTTTGFSVPTCHEDRTTSPFGCTGAPPATPFPNNLAIAAIEFVPVYRLGIWGYTLQEAVADANQGHNDKGPWEPQLLAVGKATQLVTVSLGANDMEFSDVTGWLQDCVQYQLANPNSCVDTATSKAENLRFAIQAMMNRLDVAQQNGARVVIVLYYNPYNDQKDAGAFGLLSRPCGILHSISEIIVGSLDNVLQEEAIEHGFTTVDLRPAFRTHGAGSSDSYVYGSDCDVVGALGALEVDFDCGWPPTTCVPTGVGADEGEIKKRFDPHPNEKGTAAQANEILKVVQ